MAIAVNKLLGGRDFLAIYPPENTHAGWATNGHWAFHPTIFKRVVKGHLRKVFPHEYGLMRDGKMIEDGKYPDLARVLPTKEANDLIVRPDLRNCRIDVNRFTNEVEVEFIPLVDEDGRHICIIQASYYPFIHFLLRQPGGQLRIHRIKPLDPPKYQATNPISLYLHDERVGMLMPVRP